MGKSSGKKRKRHEKKTFDSNRRKEESTNGEILAGNPLGAPVAGIPSSDKVSTRQNTDTALGTPEESKKRSRRHLDFVYPKKNGVATPYNFCNDSKTFDGDAATEELSEPSLSGNGTATDSGMKNVKESIDDILSSSKGKKRMNIALVEESLPKTDLSALTVRDSATTTTVTTTITGSALKVEEVIEGKLSGTSVEEAVRDKSGCRPRANSTDGELNLPRRGLCDETMVLQSHKWNRVRQGRAPKGFVNLGNSCFLNSTLQCLAYLPPFCQSLLAMPDRIPRENGNKASQGKRITMILRSLFQKVHGMEGQHQGGAIAPHSVVKTLPSLGTCGSRSGGYKFRPGRQEDAHEFLIHLLDAMHDGELREAGINQRLSGWRDRLPVPRLDETTFVHRIFGGYLRSQLRCAKCGYCSNTYDPFLDLALEVSKKTINTVAAAFQEFTRKETLDSDNRWKCGGCRQYVRAMKALTVFRPPLSLCVQMKRFTFGGFSSGFHTKHMFGGGGGNKIVKSIAFPAEMSLPLSDGRSCAYALTGVVIHVGGSSNSGHYTAYVKKATSTGSYQWYHMDDSFVEAVSQKTVLQQKDAYLLFYCRKEVKLEFPAPPTRRASMSAKEATEHGRARARARADSLTKIVTENDAKSTVDRKMSPASLTTTGKDSNHKLLEKNGSDNSSHEIKEETLEARSGPGASTAKANDLEKNRTKMSKDRASSESESSEDSSSDESSNDSSVSEHGRHGTEGGGSKSREEAGPKNKELHVNQSASNMSHNYDRHPIRKTAQERPREPCESDAAVSLKKKSQDDLKPLLNTPVTSSTCDSAAPLVNRMASTDSREDMPVSLPPAKESTAEIKAKPGKGVTRVVLDRGKGREKVSVMMGRSMKKRWVPQSSGRTKSGQDYDLLGNRTVGKWDDTTDAIDPEETREVSKARSHIVGGMEKKNRARKRKTYLDRWDAALDRGRTKKVKDKQEFDSATTPNSFQRIWSGLQKMKHGRPKGHLGTTTSSKKRKKR